MKINKKNIFFKRWNRKETALLFERLELYLHSGLSIDKSISIIQQGGSTIQQEQMKKIHTSVMSGTTLSHSLATHIGIARTYAGLISQGEYSGRLIHSLYAARKLIEQQDDILKKVVSACTYPIVIGCFASLLTIGLVRGVMPQITPMLNSLNVELPLLTRIVMFISDKSISYGVQIVIGIAVTFFAFVYLYNKIYLFKKAIHRIIVHTPLVGNMMYMYTLSLFLRSCGSLVDSGVSLVHTYQQVSSTITFIPFADLVQKNSSSVGHGSSVSHVFQNASKHIPPYVPQLLTAGEMSGTLGTSMIRSADIIDRDIEHSLKKLTSLLEPVMMVFMGITVGSIALSIMMPIYDISKVLQHQ